MRGVRSEDTRPRLPRVLHQGGHKAPGTKTGRETTHQILIYAGSAQRLPSVSRRSRRAVTVHIEAFSPLLTLSSVRMNSLEAFFHFETTGFGALDCYADCSLVGGRGPAGPTARHSETWWVCARARGHLGRRGLSSSAGAGAPGPLKRFAVFFPSFLPWLIFRIACQSHATAEPLKQETGPAQLV